MRFSKGGLTLRDFDDMLIVDIHKWAEAANKISKDEARAFKAAKSKRR